MNKSLSKRSATAKAAARHHKRLRRRLEKALYEHKEVAGKSDEEQKERSKKQLDMALAPIHEAFRKGEITPTEAIRQICHYGIKADQEDIREAEEVIEHQLTFGMSYTENPKLLEKQRLWKEERRRKDPVIKKALALIEYLKNNIAEYERQIQESYRYEAA